MESILFLTHTDQNGNLPKAALEVLSAAISLSKSLKGAALSIGLVGQDVKAAAQALGGCDAGKILAVSGADFGVSRYSSDAAALEALAKAAKASLILAPSTSRLNRALPGAVARLNGRTTTHVCGLDTSTENLRVQRWYYRQRMLASLSYEQRPWCILIDSGIFPAFQGEAVKTEIQELQVQLPDNLRNTTAAGFQAPAGAAQTIRPDAKLLFVAGAGWTKKQADGQMHAKEAEQLILEFVNRTQASLGSSKSLVDQSGEGHEVLSFLSHLNQVGQTGSTPRHPKGLATCCHGEEPHVVGWRFITERRAVNLDPNCGWAQGKADVLYVADAFNVLSRLNELLAK